MILTAPRQFRNLSILQRRLRPLSEIPQHLPSHLDHLSLLRGVQPVADHPKRQRTPRLPVRIQHVHGRRLRRHVLPILPDPEQEAQHPRAVQWPRHLPLLARRQLEGIRGLPRRRRSFTPGLLQEHRQQSGRRRCLEDLHLLVPLRLHLQRPRVLCDLQIYLGRGPGQDRRGRVSAFQDGRVGCRGRHCRLGAGVSRGKDRRRRGQGRVKGPARLSRCQDRSMEICMSRPCAMPCHALEDIWPLCYVMDRSESPEF